MSKWYSVEVEDHITHNVCVVGQMLTLAEARRLEKEISHFGACLVFVKEFSIFNKKKGRII